LTSPLDIEGFGSLRRHYSKLWNLNGDYLEGYTNMFKAIKKFFQKNKPENKNHTIEEQPFVDKVGVGDTHPEVIQEDKPKKGRTVLAFDTKKRVFVVKKRVARIALYNSDTQTVLLKNQVGVESSINIPLDKTQTALPLSGCWFDKEECNIGFYFPQLEHFYLLKDQHLKSIRVDAKQFKGVGDYDRMIPLSGFWFDPELETIALYDPCSALFLLKHQKDDQGAVFQYGPLKNHMQPIVGDWYGEGMDSVGLYDAESGVFFLKAAIEATVKQDISFHFGPCNSQMIPLSGDWEGTGMDKVGLYSAEDGLFFFLHSNPGTEQETSSCYFGPVGQGMIPLVGDWAGEGQEGIAIYDPQTGTAYLKNKGTSGDADMTIQFSTFDSKSVPIVVYDLI